MLLPWAFFPNDVALQMVRDYDAFLAHYDWLCRRALSAGFLFYNIVGKLHMLWHIVWHARYLNPVSHWEYEFEDFVGCMITSAQACMRGTPLHMVGTKVLQNYLLVLSLRVSS